MSEDGWTTSADAWIAALGQGGDWNRENILDAAMLARIRGKGYQTALDVGCGEGRFCRILREIGVEAIGIDPTATLLDTARERDPIGHYEIGRAEQLNFDDNRFDLVVSYLTLIDIPDYQTAIAEMSRVLKRGGGLLIANLTAFTSACAAKGWCLDERGSPLHFPVDRYLEEFSQWVSWDGITVQNWHRPLSSYMKSFLQQGLILKSFQEPAPKSGAPERVELYRRAPSFVIMEWAKP